MCVCVYVCVCVCVCVCVWACMREYSCMCMDYCVYIYIGLDPLLNDGYLLPPTPSPPLLGDLLTTPVADSQSFCFVLLVRRLNDVIFNIYYYPCLVYNFVLRFVLRVRVHVHQEHTYVWLCRYTFPGILSHYNDWLLQCTYMYMYLHRLQFVYIPPPRPTLLSLSSV